jgi:DNA gyrase/topoisomerase IV subunit B
MNFDEVKCPRQGDFAVNQPEQYAFASGSITSCRAVNNQAVFTLKGKPLNVWNLKRDIVYKNDEMYNLMRALDIEDNIERLRYDKVILATDADVDGLHIRNLMITYFFRFFEQVVHDGHLYVLETPLFRVRNKQETIYCYSEAERDAASAKLGGKPACVAEAGGESEEDSAGKTQSQLIVPATSARRRPEITRFKGLGEISPNEFKQFIGKEMRLRCFRTATRWNTRRRWTASRFFPSTWARTRLSGRITSWRIWW